jgi:hypothetical protein
VTIGNGSCRNPSLVPIYATSGADTCVMLLIEIMFKAFEGHKLFILTPIARYSGQLLEWKYFSL